MLEKLEQTANVSEWDVDTIYKDILEGNTDYYLELKSHLEFAKWFAKRYGVKN